VVVLFDWVLASLAALAEIAAGHCESGEYHPPFADFPQPRLPGDSRSMRGDIPLIAALTGRLGELYTFPLRNRVAV
jgi:hypothetical protein